MQMVQNGDDSVTWSIEPSRAPDRDKASIALGLDAEEARLVGRIEGGHDPGSCQKTVVRGC